MSCAAGCLELQIAPCTNPIIRAGLPATTLLQAIIKRPGSTTIYKREITTGGAGELEIDRGTLPDGFFAYGYFELELRKGSPEWATVQIFTVGSSTYQCALLEVADIDE